MIDTGEDGFQPNDGLRAMGVLEPVPLESMGPAKVRAFTYSTVSSVAGNCLCLCAFVPWNAAERTRILRAATGWDVSAYEYYKVGERALALARIFNIREGFGPQDDRLALRSYGPTTSGALAEGGIDPEKLEEAVHTHYAMMGWDKETGVPTVEKLYELGIGWAAEYLPQ
jgi:aldehyde:ferredoxin oxidoreductase